MPFKTPATKRHNKRIIMCMNSRVILFVCVDTRIKYINLINNNTWKSLFDARNLFPQGIMFLLEPLNPEFSRASNNLGDTFDLIALINNSVNFMLYCTMSTQFRQLSYSLLCKPCSQIGTNANSNGFRPMLQVNSNKHVPIGKKQNSRMSEVWLCTPLPSPPPKKWSKHYPNFLNSQ